VAVVTSHINNMKFATTNVMEDLKMLKVKHWKETVKDRRTRRDLAEKAKTHKCV
jgi:hypothetical protein